MCGCVFTVASWGVGSPHVLSELKGPAVILTERNMEADKRKDPCSPPKRQKRQRHETESTQSSLQLQWPGSCNKRDQGDRRRVKPATASASH